MLGYHLVFRSALLAFCNFPGLRFERMSSTKLTIIRDYPLTYLISFGSTFVVYYVRVMLAEGTLFPLAFLDTLISAE